MRVFLAASCSGVNETDRKSVIVNNPPLYLLETFYNGPKICSKVLNDVGRENFLMDSGAFTFVHSKKTYNSQGIRFVCRATNSIYQRLRHKIFL